VPQHLFLRNTKIQLIFEAQFFRRGFLFSEKFEIEKSNTRGHELPTRIKNVFHKNSMLYRIITALTNLESLLSAKKLLRKLYGEAAQNEVQFCKRI